MSPSMSPLPRSLKTESECENSDEIPDSKRKTKSSSLAETVRPPPAKRPKLNDTSDRLVAANDTSVNVVSCANSSLKKYCLNTQFSGETQEQKTHQWKLEARSHH